MSANPDIQYELDSRFENWWPKYLKKLPGYATWIIQSLPLLGGPFKIMAHEVWSDGAHAGLDVSCTSSSTPTD